MDILDQIKGTKQAKKVKKPSIHAGANESSSSQSGKNVNSETLGQISNILNDTNLSYNQLRIPHFDLPPGGQNKPESHKHLPVIKPGKQNKFMIEAMNSSLGVILSESNSECSYECSSKSTKLRKIDIYPADRNRKNISIHQIQINNDNKKLIGKKSKEEQEKQSLLYEIKELRQKIEILSSQKEQLAIRLKQTEQKAKQLERQVTQVRESRVEEQRKLFEQHQIQIQKWKQKMEKKYRNEIEQVEKNLRFQSSVHEEKLKYQIESLKYVMEKQQQLIKRSQYLNKRTEFKISQINQPIFLRFQQQRRIRNNNQADIKQLEEKKRLVQNIYNEFYKEKKQYSQKYSQQISTLEEKRKKFNQQVMQTRSKIHQEKVAMEEEAASKLRECEKKLRQVEISKYQVSLMKKAIQKQKSYIKKVHETLTTQLKHQKEDLAKQKERVIQQQLFNRFSHLKYKCADMGMDADICGDISQKQKSKGHEKSIDERSIEKIKEYKQGVKQVATFGDYLLTLSGDRSLKRKWKEAHLQIYK